MIEWARNNEPTHRSRNDFIWHQLLLSLLYDDVSAQDETIVCSKRLASWFSGASEFATFAKLLECGAIGLLKRPLGRYPTPELQERARIYPIHARREHLEQFSVDNRGKPARFNPKQAQFHNLLEAHLIDHPHSHRFAGERAEPRSGLMIKFAARLREVLTDPRYAPWLKRRFRNLTVANAEEFVRSMSDRSRIIDRLRKSNLRIPARYDEDSVDPIFDTAVAMQLAASFEPKSASAFQELIETVFAEPYCQEERSEGRYGRKLQALPLAVELDQDGRLPDVRVVHVEPISVGLPTPDADLPQIIHSIREKPSGRRLRDTMQTMGSEPNFVAATRAWKDVAADLASSMSAAQTRKVTIHTLVGESVRGAVFGFLGELAWAPELDHGLHLPLGAVTGATLDVSGNLLGRSLRFELKRSELVESLDSALQFSCVKHPLVRQIDLAR